MFTFAPRWDFIIFGLHALLPTGYQRLYLSPTSLDCHRLPPVWNCVGDQLGQRPREPFPIPQRDHLQEVCGRLSRKNRSCYYSAVNLTFLKTLHCALVLEHQSHRSPDQDVSLPVNCCLYTTLEYLDICLFEINCADFVLSCCFILSDVFRFSPPFGGVT